jgi:PRTRC genetic system protein B
MELNTCFPGSDANLHLKAAILLYGAHNGVSHATMNHVSTSETGAVIEPGQLLTREALETALVSMSTRVGIKTWRYVDDSVVASGPSMVTWWTPARERHVFFDPVTELPSGVTAQPPMLWVVSGGGKTLSVFTLKEDCRPTLDTMVYCGVHYNVYLDGGVCLGTSEVPDDMNPHSWERMFYASAFTHANGGTQWQCKTRGGVKALWRRLLAEGGKKKFPLNALKPTGNSVEKILDKVGR